MERAGKALHMDNCACKRFSPVKLVACMVFIIMEGMMTWRLTIRAAAQAGNKASKTGRHLQRWDTGSQCNAGSTQLTFPTAILKSERGLRTTQHNKWCLRWRWEFFVGWKTSTQTHLFLASRSPVDKLNGRISVSILRRKTRYSCLQLERVIVKRKEYITKHEGREIRTPNLLIWSQTRCRCAMPPM